ncbi:MAG: protein kinase [Cyanobacteria bacterium P01_G01_bin.39]
MQWIPGHKLKNRPYRIEQELGQGGFGITYKARDLTLDVSVVIKTPNRKLQRDHNYQKYVKNFIREAKQLAKLGLNPHPNIVRVISLFEEDNLPCIVMDLIPGQSLYDLVLNQGKLSQTQALKYIRQIGSALVVCHHAGIIHRDVHPNNILIHANNGQAILIDFGISGTTQTSRNTHSGNRCFAPWEQMAYWERQDSKTPQVDIYTLAASLYFLVTGQEPTECLARKYNQSELIAPKQFNSELSDKVNQAILKGLEIEPSDRPSSMQEWLELLLATSQTSVTPSEVISKVPIVQTATENQYKNYQIENKANNSDRLADVEVAQPRGKTNINAEEKEDLSSVNNKAVSTIKNTSKISASQPKNKALIVGSFVFLTAIFGIYAAYNSIFNVTEIPEAEEPISQIPTENQEDISESPRSPEAEEPTSEIETNNKEDISESSQIPEPEISEAEESTSEIETNNKEDISGSSQLPKPEILEAEESTSQIETESQEDISEPETEEATSEIETDSAEDIPEESQLSEAEEPTSQIETESQDDIPEEPQLPETEEPTSEIETESTGDISESSKFELIATLDSHSGQVDSIAFSPDGRILASGSGDRTIKLWDVASQQEIATLEGHSEIVYSVAFNSDGKILASGSGDDTVKLWNVNTQQEIVTLTNNDNDIDIHSVAFSPDGKTLASGGDFISLWDINTQQEIASLPGSSLGVSSIAFSPDGRVLANGGYYNDSSDDTLKLWNLETQQEITTLTDHNSAVSSVAFSSDGKVLASGSYDSTIKVWNLETQEEIVTLTGHSDVVSSVAFSPDGKMLASGSRDNTIKVWNLETQQEIATLTGNSPNSGVISVAFSPDGKILASGDYEYTIKLWKMPPNLE